MVVYNSTPEQVEELKTYINDKFCTERNLRLKKPVEMCTVIDNAKPNPKERLLNVLIDSSLWIETYCNKYLNDIEREHNLLFGHPYAYDYGYPYTEIVERTEEEKERDYLLLAEGLPSDKDRERLHRCIFGY